MSSDESLIDQDLSFVAVAGSRKQGPVSATTAIPNPGYIAI